VEWRNLLREPRTLDVLQIEVTKLAVEAARPRSQQTGTLQHTPAASTRAVTPLTMDIATNQEHHYGQRHGRATWQTRAP
jgi:hypothetical protein